MSRKTKYLVQEKIVLHVFNQGLEPVSGSPVPPETPMVPDPGNRRLLFRRPGDYDAAIKLFLDAQAVTSVKVLLHALLPDRIDLVLLQQEPYASSRFMQRACQPFSRLMNGTLKRCGHFFHARFGVKPVPSAPALLDISYTMHASPVDAGLVQRAEEWPYTSCESCLQGTTLSLSDPSPVISLVGGKDNYGRFLDQYNRACPGSAELFLCPQAASAWKELALTHRRIQKKSGRPGRK